MSTLQQMLQTAQQHHQAGRLPQAEAIYRQILARQGQHPDALHLLGVLALQTGQLDTAQELIGRAISLQPSRPDFHCNLGLALAAAGKTDQAMAAYQRALSLRPDYPEAHNNLGVALTSLRRFNEAIDAYRQALALRPSYPEALNNLGSALREQGRDDQAIDAFRQALAVQADFAQARGNLGNALCQANRPDEAVDVLQKGLERSPQDPEILYSLGNALCAAKRLEQAIDVYRRLLVAQPQRVEAQNNLANTLLALGRVDEAVAAFQDALALRPDAPTIMYNLANALGRAGRHEQAIEMLRKTLALHPDSARVHNNLGRELQDLGQVDDAIAAFSRAIALQGDFALAHCNRGMALLLKGDYRQGWAEYEWRWKVNSFDLPARAFPQQLWDGGDLRGRRILLYAEQGFGDAIQFVRYAPLIAQRGAHLTLFCQPPLRRLFQSVRGVQDVVAGNRDVEVHVHYPLLSLPRLLDTTLESIPANVPYLHADPQLAAQWRSRLPTDARLKVGLVWHGRSLPEPGRSIPPDLLSPLARIPNVSFFSLQTGDAPAPPADLHMSDWSRQITDFADTAALMENLDLVITIDTAAAHLAGAMGKPAWVLLKFAPDWRWLLERTDSPWYPTMRLFRQPKAGDWENVIERTANALAQLAAGSANPA
ncbi:MAG: tetratricopeptide repeat protein [Tepidisphaeraceae bacterium]|jgi:Flp pilus assembly protein TadD